MDTLTKCETGKARAAESLAEVVTALDAARECLDGARYDDTTTAGQFRTLTEARDLVQQARRLVEGALLEACP